MRALPRQFFITFATMGSVLAYLPVFLSSRLESMTQVGVVMSTTGLAVILTPVIMTALADSKVQSRSIIALLFAVASVTCFWQAQSTTYLGLFISHAVFAFFFWPLAALQDGLVFADNQQAERDGRAPTPYHRVRVYGTVGFAVPLGFLYFLLGDETTWGIGFGYEANAALIIGGCVCALGALNALTLPRTQLGQARQARFGERDDATNKPKRIPTFAAARVLFRGPALLFCICLLIAHLGNSAYYAFYPLYLTETVGFSDAMVGPITMLGVVLELGVMAAVGVMIARLGMKRLIVLGLSVMVVRFALLGLFPTQPVAVWTQVMHGITVVAIYVVPPIYLNAIAGDHFRSSIQGLYAMTVFGPSRVAGNVFGGMLSDNDLPLMFLIVAGSTLIAVIGLALGMRLPPAHQRSDEDVRDVPAMVEGD